MSFNAVIFRKILFSHPQSVLGQLCTIVFVHCLAKEALIKKGEDFAGRPQDMYLAEIYSRGYEDIGFSDYGVKWKLMRKITHGSMKMYGSGLEDLEKNVLLETKQLLRRLDKKEAEPIDPKNDISKSVVSLS